VPTLLLYGADDARAPVAVAVALRDAIPTAQLVGIPDVGHLSNVEAPERFNAEVRRFLSHCLLERFTDTVAALQCVA
jgi:pimeloyl-ACP methyl ester carboxylesterase